jgi:hypothetical protein
MFPKKLQYNKQKNWDCSHVKYVKPPDVSSSNFSSNKAQGQGATVQCKGTTKAGTRCKHMTRIANGLLFPTPT